MPLSISQHISNIGHIISAGLNDAGSIHPLIVHFPVGLLFIAPLFLILGITLKNHSKSFYIAALLLMVLGTACLYWAVSSGNAAAEVLERPPVEAVRTLDTHLQLGEQAQLNFTILSIAFLILTLACRRFDQALNRKLQVSLMLIYLVIYSLNLAILFNAAHYGGKLVHEHGIRSSLYNVNEQ